MGKYVDAVKENTLLFNKNKKTKGITLIALIITIVIILILAGISISSLTGSRLFEKAKLAEQKTNVAEKDEENHLSLYENEIDDYLKNSEQVNNGQNTDKIIKKLIQPMTSNTSVNGTCSGKNGEESSNPLYLAFDGNDKTYGNSGGTYQQEDYMQYEFNNYVTFESVEIQFAQKEHIFSSCKVTASKDGINWDTILENNEFSIDKLKYTLEVKNEYKNNEYKYIRVWQLGTRLGGGDNRMCVADIQLYGTGKLLTKLTENMTSNVSINGTCHYRDGELSGYPAYYTFDGNPSTTGQSGSINTQDDYIEYDFENEVTIEKIELLFYQYQIPSECKVTAVYDGENWDTIIQTKEFTTNSTKYILDVSEQYKNKKYKKVRIWQIGTRLSGGDNRMGIMEATMYGM